MPGVKGYQYVLWLLAIVTIILRRYTTIAIGAALVVGIIRRVGKVQFNAEFVQRALFTEDF